MYTDRMWPNQGVSYGSFENQKLLPTANATPNETTGGSL